MIMDYQINKNLLLEILSIPSYTRSEELVRDFIINYIKDMDNVQYFVDHIGNIYITKGEIDGAKNEYYPCVVAHMDTVHVDQYDHIKNNRKLTIKEVYNENHKTDVLMAFDPINGNNTGIGGDDKCGIYLCLEFLKSKDTIKVAFFMGEEQGMIGSKEANQEFFNDVGYAIQFDAPTGDWFSLTCNGIPLFSDEYANIVIPILKTHGVTNFSYDPFTDVVQLRKKFDFCCSVMFSGYYRQHTKHEYVLEKDIVNSYIISNKLIEDLGYKRYYIPSFG